MNTTITQAHVNLPELFWMLSSVPNLNRLTTFTALINVKAQVYESYKQRCWDDTICPLW